MATVDGAVGQSASTHSSTASPRPPAYTPPDERSLDDASLEYLSPSHPMRQKREAHMEAIRRSRGEAAWADLGADQLRAPSLPSGEAPPAGQEEEPWKEPPLPENFSGISRGDYDWGRDYEEEGDRLGRVLSERIRPTAESSSSGRRERGHVCLEGEEEEESGRPAAAARLLNRRQELEIDTQKLEFFEGSPQYPQMLADYRRKYAKELGMAGESDASSSEKNGEREYDEQEVERGLEAEPLDYLRTSQRAQALMNEGPRAYDPLRALQRQGLARFQGYAFPPSTKLGMLQIPDQAAPPNGVFQRVYHRLVGRDKSESSPLGAADDGARGVVAGEGSVPQDTSLVFRVTGLDIVQRRQMRYMLSDFDYADRQTAFHVMMTYPHTDWLHVFFMVGVGVGLYHLQLHYHAYDFYDEYLGLDLRQTPSAKKPFLVGVTTVVMVFFLFQPLLVASIAATRAYRIIMRRPIGPP